MITVGEGVDLPVDVLPSATDDLCAEHGALAQEIQQLTAVADAIAARPVAEHRSDIERVLGLVAGPILQHIRTEYDHHAHLAFRDCRPVPARADVERIEREAAQLADLGQAVLDGGASDAHALRAALFDLHTVLQLHFASPC